MTTNVEIHERRFRLHDLHVDTAIGEVTGQRGSERLDPKVLAVLLVLAERHGHVVTRDELLQQVWANVPVTDDAVSRCIYQLRRAFGRASGNPSRRKLIETLSKRGYRLNAPVLPPDTTDAVVPDASSREALPPTTPKRFSSWRWSVAILPAAVVTAVGLSHLTGYRSDLLAPSIGRSTPDAVGLTDVHQLRISGAGMEPQSYDPIAPAARDAFVQAHHFYNRRGPGDLARAEERYRAAVEISPHFARAWAGLAAIYNLQLFDRSPPNPTEVLDQMRIAVERALAAGPDHVDVQLRAANYYMWIGDFERADAMRKRAAELDPDDPLLLAVLSGGAAQNGRFEEAVEYGLRAVARDPLSAVTRANLARSLLALGRCAEAYEMFQDVAALTPSDVDVARELDYEMARIAVCEGRDADAVTRAGRLPPGVDREQILALAAASIGQEDTAAAALDRLLADGSWRAALAAATVYAWREDTMRAHRHLQSAYAAAFQQGRIAIDELIMRARGSPFMIALRDTDDWRTWVGRADESWCKQCLIADIRQADAS